MKAPAKLSSWYLAAVLMAVFSGVPFVFADAQSASYSITDDRWTGGSGFSLNSSSYFIEESSIESSWTPAMSSGNFSNQAPAGIGGSTLAAIGSVTPGNYARFFSDESASFVVNAVDPDNDTLQYQAKQDGSVKAGPQSSSTLSWTLGNGDLGRRSIALEVLDPDGTVIRNQTIYIYRRPVK